MAAFDHELPRIADSDFPLPPILQEADSPTPVFDMISACPACSEAFDDSTRAPRILGGCGHTVCDRCVRINTTHTTDVTTVTCRLASHEGGRSVCGAETQLKAGESLAINLVLLEFVASLKEEAAPAALGCTLLHFPKRAATTTKLRQQRDEPLECIECDAPKRLAEFHCGVCTSFFCSEHWDVVHKYRALSSHLRVAVTANDCSRHAGESMDRYCIDPSCSKQGSLMCSRCEEAEAHGHAGKLVTAVVTDKRKELQRAVEQLQSCTLDHCALLSKAYSALHDALTVLNTADDRQFLSLFRGANAQVALAVGEYIAGRQENQQCQRQLNEEVRLRQEAEAVAARLAVELEESKEVTAEIIRAHDEAQRRAIEEDVERRRRNDPRGLRTLVASSSGTLYLNDKQIEDDGCWLVADALKINSTLTELGLSHNQIGDAGSTAIGDALKINSTLTNLSISSNRIGDAGCTAIGDALKINTTLTGLGLSENQISGAGFRSMGEALKLNATLTSLHLLDNRVGVAGCTLISEALKVNSTLVTLHLGTNEIGDAGCQLIADALKFNSTLTTLHLSTNQIGDLGCTAIADALKINSTLTLLHLSYNLIGDAGCTLLCDALQLNSTLTSLHLSRNRISEVAKSLARRNLGSRQVSLSF